MLEVRAARHGDAPALDALGAAPEELGRRDAFAVLYWKRMGPSSVR